MIAAGSWASATGDERLLAAAAVGEKDEERAAAITG
jgi:hypothetical protein